MTGAQRSSLETLASEAGEEPGEDLTKAQASKKIDDSSFLRRSTFEVSLARPAGRAHLHSGA
jgi:hypothetical protein